jgi:hypothetical protein
VQDVSQIQAEVCCYTCSNDGNNLQQDEKVLGQQILFWAVKKHAKDKGERKENWKKLLLDCTHLQEVNWLDLCGKRLSALSARNVKVTGACAVI